jgi:hypothetical protein
MKMIQEDCSICLDALGSADSSNLKQARCGHSFHKECIDKWIDDFHWRCPLCRGQMTEITRYKNLMERNGVMFYGVVFDGKPYVIKETDYLEVRNRFDLVQSSNEDDNQKYNDLVMTVILFSIIKTSNLEEAYTKAKPVLLRT